MDIDGELMALLKERPAVFFIPNLPESGTPVDPSWLTETVPAGQVARMEDERARMTPQAVRTARQLWEVQARNLAKLNAAGVRIAFGTDAGNTVGWNAHTELADMVAAGMTPAQALVAATRTSAEILRLDRFGTLAAGKSADFIVLNANPLDEITNTRRIDKVYLRGQEINRAALRAMWTGRASTSN